jgi:hypothetical protein
MRWSLSSVAGLACIASATASGAEFVVRDAQVELSALPTGFNYHASGGPTEVSGSDAFTSGTGLSGGVRWSWTAPGSALGVLGGADVVTNAFTYGGGGGMAEVGVRVAGGGGWAISDEWQMLGEVGLGYGAAKLDLNQSDSIPGASFNGPATTYDAHLSGTYQAWRHLQVMLSVGWQVSSYKLTGDGLDLTLDRSGPTVGLGLTWRIDDSPPRVR